MQLRASALGCTRPCRSFRRTEIGMLPLVAVRLWEGCVVDRSGRVGRPRAVRHNLDPAAQEAEAAAAAGAGGEAEEDEDDDSGSSAHWNPQRRCLPARSDKSCGARNLNTSLSQPPRTLPAVQLPAVPAPSMLAHNLRRRSIEQGLAPGRPRDVKSVPTRRETPIRVWLCPDGVGRAWWPARASPGTSACASGACMGRRAGRRRSWLGSW